MGHHHSVIHRLAASHRIWGVAALSLALASCSSPLQRDAERELRTSLLASQRQRLASIANAGVIELQRAPSVVEADLSDKQKHQLDEMSGPKANAKTPLNVGKNLLGQGKTQAVQMSLGEAVDLAMRHNLDVQVAQVTPAIAQTQLTQAEAAFDAVFFTTADWQKLDTPNPEGNVTGLSGNTRENNLALSAGIRKPLLTGGEATVQTDLSRLKKTPSVFALTSFYRADVLMSLTQPLLRNFGSDVNRAQIELAANTSAATRQQLRQQLLQTAFDTEQAYWNLVLARETLLINQRLLGATLDDRNRLKQRAQFDVSPVQVTEANSFVELQRSDVIRTREQLRLASDALKQLIHSPKLPLADETLILPTDTPADVPIKFNLLDTVTTAMQRRPELQQALLSIKDASIRQRVADNARLPILNLTATVRYNGLGNDDVGDAYDNVADGDFIDYLLGGQFEMPIGNRGPQALYDQRRLERRQSVLQYRRQAQAVVLDVKNALRSVLTNYELIGSARAARRAAADNVRAINVQEQAGAALTPEFLLDLKLTAQQRLADAETQEAQARSNYMTSIAQLYQATGTLLKHNHIEVK